MYKATTTIKNKTGLHARPASDFVRKARGFSSDITIGKVGEEAVDAKSIVYLLSLGLGQGTEIEISAEGADEQLAVDTLIATIDEGFGE